jgi:hypothetical protein
MDNEVQDKEVQTRILASAIAEELLLAEKSISFNSIRRVLFSRHNRNGGTDLLSKISKEFNEKAKAEAAKNLSPTARPASILALLDKFLEDCRALLRAEFCEKFAELENKAQRMAENEILLNTELARVAELTEIKSATIERLEEANRIAVADLTTTKLSVKHYQEQTTLLENELSRASARNKVLFGEIEDIAEKNKKHIELVIEMEKAGAGAAIHALEEQVQALMEERNTWANKLTDARSEAGELRGRVSALQEHNGQLLNALAKQHPPAPV